MVHDDRSRIKNMICKICNKSCNDVGKHSFHAHNITSEEYFNKYYKNKSDGTCFICNKKTRFKGIISGYCKYCSDICSSKDEAKNKKISKSVLSDDCKNRTLQTNRKKYGVDYTAQSNIVKMKMEKTCKRKYNSNTPFESKLNQDKVKKSIKEKFGYDNVGQHPDIKEKIKNTCLKKYGYKSHLYDSNIKEKIKKYNLNKYGVEYKFQSNTFRYNSMYNGRYKIKKYLTKFNTTLHYQTKPELRFIEYCERNKIIICDGDKISYYFNNKKRVYFCDFKIKENNTWRLIEIKKKHKWWYSELASGKMKEKIKAAIQFSKNNNYLPYKIKFDF